MILITFYSIKKERVNLRSFLNWIRCLNYSTIFISTSLETVLISNDRDPSRCLYSLLFKSENLILSSTESSLISKPKDSNIFIFKFPETLFMVYYLESTLHLRFADTIDPSISTDTVIGIYIVRVFSDLLSNANLIKPNEKFSVFYFRPFIIIRVLRIMRFIDYNSILFVC